MPRVMHQPWAAAITGVVQGLPSLRHGSRASSGEPRLPVGERGANLGQVEAAGEVLAVGEEHPAPQIVVALEQLVGAPELSQQLDVEGVALRRAVEAHQQHVAAPLERDDPIPAHGVHVADLASHCSGA